MPQAQVFGGHGNGERMMSSVAVKLIYKHQ